MAADWAIVQARTLLWKIGAACPCQPEDLPCGKCALVAQALRTAKDDGTRATLASGARIERMFTLRDIARAVGVGLRTVEEWVAKGSLGSVKVGNERKATRRIPASAYREMLERTGRAWKPKKKREPRATIVST